MVAVHREKNPFPGMNPYLERHWRDVHTRLMTYLCDQLQTQLPAGLWASIEEAVTIDTQDAAPPRLVRPDVHATESWDATRGPEGTAAGQAVAEPIVIVDPEPPTQRHVQIVAAGGRVVTAIEVLSATNKIDWERRRAYQQKRRAYREAGVNLVEIDLIRDGGYLVLAPEAEIPESRRAPYVVSIWRAADPTKKFAYPCPLRQRLPRIPIPLRPDDDRDAVADLQELLDLCYERGRYHTRLDYRSAPEPRLSPPDADWADELLRTAGLR